MKTIEFKLLSIVFDVKTPDGIRVFAEISALIDGEKRKQYFCSEHFFQAFMDSYFGGYYKYCKNWF